MQTLTPNNGVEMPPLGFGVFQTETGKTVGGFFPVSPALLPARSGGC